ncbi:MAG: hypothetical protein ACK5L7_09000, partial [Paludibacteraceae bacterium]
VPFNVEKDVECTLLHNSKFNFKITFNNQIMRQIQTANNGQHSANFGQFVTYFGFWGIGYELVTQLCPKLAFLWLYTQTLLNKKSPANH